MRSHIRRGEPPHNCAASVFERLTLTGHLQPEDNLTSDELRYLQKLYDGYFAFEALTRRDWDSAICGICGIGSATAGKIEVQKMAPWIPPACRSATVFNSEVHKGEIVYLLHGLCMCTLS